MFLEKIEGKKISLPFFLVAFFAIVLVRYLLEMFLEFQVIPRFGEFFFHFVLWYASVFLTAALVFSFFAGKQIEKTSKTVLAFWFLIALVPLIDFVVSGGKGFEIRYIFGSLQTLLENFLTVGGFLSGNGAATFGQGLVALAGVVGAFIYIKLSKRNFSRALAGAGVFYFLLLSLL